MGGIFGELEKLGFKNIKEEEIFKMGDQKNKEEEKGTQSTEEKKEEEYLFEKSYSCPVCENKFTEHTVKAGKARRIASDLDLRPRYTGIDATKYNIVFCKKCGYAALLSSFAHISPVQRKLLKEEVQKNYGGVEEKGMILSYEEAILRFKLALYCSMVKHGRNSEKAYICLQTAWMFRGMAEQLEASGEGKKEVLDSLRGEERAYIERAHTGFVAAVANEMFPICGMDEMTFNYLLAELSRRVGKIGECRKLLGMILVSKTASPVVKDRARRLKDILAEENSE